jgi:hypothetical protein
MCQSMGKKHLLVGGVVAVGFDVSGRSLLVVSHSGRGLFAVDGWTRVARDLQVLYPNHGRIAGIGPLEGQEIEVIVRDENRSAVELHSPNGQFRVLLESDGVTVHCTHNKPLQPIGRENAPSG